MRVVNNSASPNVAQLVGSQSGDMIVPMYNWSEDKSITQMHHFHFGKATPGIVEVQYRLDDTKRSLKIPRGD